MVASSISNNDKNVSVSSAVLSDGDQTQISKLKAAASVFVPPPRDESFLLSMNISGTYDRVQATKLKAAAPIFVPPPRDDPSATDDRFHATNLKVTAPLFIPPSKYNPSLQSSITSTTTNQVHTSKLKAAAPLFVPPTTVADQVRTSKLKAAAPVFVPPPTNNSSLLSSNVVDFFPIMTLNHQPPALCRFFLLGACRKGLDCPFLHDINAVPRNSLTHNKTSDPETATYFVEEGIQCEFGPGLSIVKLSLGEVKKPVSKLAVSGLPVGYVTELDVEARLSPYGSLIGLVCKNTSDTKESVFFCVAIFSESNAAASAAKALNGSVVASWIGVGGVAPPRQCNAKISSGAVVAVVKNDSGASTNVQGVSVKVQWYSPSRCAWTQFSNKQQAEKAARTWNGLSFGGRVLTATLQRPEGSYRYSMIPRLPTFKVWLGNLGEHVTASKLQSFLKQHAKCHVSSIVLGDLPFTDKSSPLLVQKLLREHGNLISFELDKSNDSAAREGSLKRKALARFASERDTQRVCDFFQTQQSISALGGSRLFVQRLFFVKYTLPTVVFDALNDELDKSVKGIPGVRYTLFQKEGSRTISIKADNASYIDDTSSKLNDLLRGEVVRDPTQQNRALWNRYVSSSQFAAALHSLAPEKGACIWCDGRRHEVRIFGSDAQLRKQIAARVVSHCSEALMETHAIPIALSDFEFIIHNGRKSLDKITIAAAARKVSVDIKNRCLLVEGPVTAAKRAEVYVRKLITQQQSNEIEERLLLSSDACPVCFCSPGDSEGGIVRLSCEHVYCRECCDAWLSENSLCNFPVVCLAGDCNTPLVLDDLKNGLDSSAYFALLKMSVDNYVRQDPLKLQFCPIAMCPGIYSIDESCLRSTCSTCSTTICTQCKLNHGDMSCEEHQRACQPPDYRRMQIVDDILTLRCPRCRQAFLDFDGCFALRCGICPCGFCGWCLKDCGTDAHSHVATCSYKPRGADKYFGSEQQFKAAQNENRRKLLVDFLKELQPVERQLTIDAIQQDLNDLGLHLKETTASKK